MKKIPYARQWINRADISAVVDSLRSDYLTQGPRVAKFEEAVAYHCGARYAVVVNSGTSALHLACVAAGLKGGDELVTSAITFAASANCALYCGARPVFADVLDDTICIDPEDVALKITRRTKVIIPVHFGGHPCDIDRIRDIADGRKITVIEDACHALGALFRGSKIGSCRYSAMTVMSFHAVKHIATGEGGVVLTNDKRLYRMLAMLRTHGMTRDPELMAEDPGAWHYEMQMLGYNYRLTDIQSALGSSQMKRLAEFIERRRYIAKRYDEAFSGVAGLRLPEERPYARSSYHLYVLRFSKGRFSVSRGGIFETYRKRGIWVNVHYMPVYRHPYYKKLGYRSGICPAAEKYYEEAITLPLYPKMSDAEVARVIRVTIDIASEFKRSSRAGK